MQDPIEEDNRVPVGGDGNFVADMTDDDATVLDSLVSSEAEPPDADELPIVRLDMRPLAAKPIPAIDRMIARTMDVPPRTPILIATANPYRRELRITGNSGNNTLLNYQYAATATECQNPLTSYNSYASVDDNSYVLSYNGELWMYYDGTLAGRISIMEIINQETGR